MITILRLHIGGLNLLKRDVNEYYKVVQKYEYFKSSGSAKKSEFKVLKNKKYEIENRWGLIGRHRVERQRIHPSRVCEGCYIDVVFTGAVPVHFKVRLMVPHYNKRSLSIESVYLKIFIAPDIGGSVSFSHIHTLPAFLSPITAKLKATKDEKILCKQFYRNTKTLSVNVNLGDSGTVAAGAHAGS